MKIQIFYCANCLDTTALRTHLANNGSGAAEDKDEIKTISLPCSGKVNLLYLLKAFETGSDGVLLITCEEGACQFLEGNLRARKRAQAVDSLLEESGLGTGRILVVRKNKEGFEQITAALAQLKNTII